MPVAFHAAATTNEHHQTAEHSAPPTAHSTTTHLNATAINGDRNKSNTHQTGGPFRAKSIIRIIS